MFFKSGIDYLDYVSERIVQFEEKIVEQIVRLDEEKKNIFMHGMSDNDKVQTSISDDNIINELARIEELEEKVNDLIEKKYIVKRTALKNILKLESDENKEILIDKYINNMTNNDLAKIEKVDVRTIQRRHKKALSEFCKIYQPFETNTWLVTPKQFTVILEIV